MKNNDIRSQARHDCYDAVAQQLNQLGVPAAVVPGILPQGAKDVLGIMTGTGNSISAHRARSWPRARFATT